MRREGKERKGKREKLNGTPREQVCVCYRRERERGRERERERVL